MKLPNAVESLQIFQDQCELWVLRSPKTSENCSYSVKFSAKLEIRKPSHKHQNILIKRNDHEITGNEGTGTVFRWSIFLYTCSNTTSNSVDTNEHY